MQATRVAPSIAQRVRFLWQSALEYAHTCPAVARALVYVMKQHALILILRSHNMKQVAFDSEYELPADVVQWSCQRCSTVFVPGVNCTVALSDASFGKKHHRQAQQSRQPKPKASSTTDDLFKYVKTEEKQTAYDTELVRTCKFCAHDTVTPAAPAGAVTKKRRSWQKLVLGDVRLAQQPAPVLAVPPAEMTDQFISLQVSRPAWLYPEAAAPQVPAGASVLGRPRYHTNTAAVAAHASSAGGKASAGKRPRDERAPQSGGRPAPNWSQPQERQQQQAPAGGSARKKNKTHELSKIVQQQQQQQQKPPAAGGAASGASLYDFLASLGK